MQHFAKNIVTSTIPGSQFVRNFPPSPSDSLICMYANSLRVCVCVLIPVGFHVSVYSVCIQ